MLFTFTGATALMLSAGIVWGSATTAPASEAWEPKLLQYTRAEKLQVQESTPTRDQLAFYARPARIDVGEFAPSEKHAKPQAVGDANVVHLTFRDADGDLVPALLCTPKNKTGPFPLVIAVHGMRSNKLQVCGQLAPLIKRGFAILAPDMPLHGERPGDPNSIWNPKDPMHTVKLYRQAIIDVRQCIDLAETRPELDLTRGVILAGYSMGSWINSVAGPVDSRVRAMVLMVGGATDVSPAKLFLPQISAVDPLVSIAHFASRPLLMLSARYDPIVTPEMSRRLYSAAAEPKTQRWYESGHLLPDDAYKDAAQWIEKTWESLPVK